MWLVHDPQNAAVRTRCSAILGERWEAPGRVVRLQTTCSDHVLLASRRVVTMSLMPGRAQAAAAQRRCASHASAGRLDAGTQAYSPYLTWEKNRSRQDGEYALAADAAIIRGRTC